MKLDNNRIQVCIIIVLCFITRIPQLISPHLILDGDECIVGLMSRHIMQGREFPLFFYGQAYGLSIFECLFIIPFYWMLGMSAVAVKLAMLSLWTIGVVCFYKALLQMDKGKQSLAFIITLLLVCSPAWAVWSMKARGGYITAFTLTSVVLYLAYHQRYGQKHITYFISGLLVPVVYEAQMLWLPGLLLLMAYPLSQNFTWARLLSFILPCFVLFIIFWLHKQDLSHYFEPVYTFPTYHTANYFLRIPEYIFQSIQGNYYFTEIEKPYFFNAVFAAIFTGFILLMPFIGIFMAMRSYRKRFLLLLSSFTVLPVLFATVFDFRMEPRFMLPVTGYALICLFLLFRYVSAASFRPVFASLGVVSIMGLIAHITFYNYSFSAYTHKQLIDLTRQINDRGIHYAFCPEPLLAWQVNFYSQEKLIARDGDMPGRYPPYFRAVNNAFFTGGKTAIISSAHHFYGLEIKDPQNIEGFFVNYYPPKVELDKRFGF